MTTGKNTDIQAFERHLLGLRRLNGTARYTPQTVRTYVSAVRGVLERHRGNFVSAVKAGQLTPAGGLARSAGLVWAEWKGDARLRDQLRYLRVTDVNCRETQSVDTPAWRRIETEVRTLPEPQQSALLLIVVSGLRIGDIFLLTRPQVQLATTNREVSVLQKGRKARTWSPSQDEREALRTLLTHPWQTVRDIFDPHATRGGLRDDQHYAAAYHVVRKLLREVCKTADVPYVRPHRFRHTAASFIIHENLGDAIDVQKMLGHADLRTTSRYYLHSEADRQSDMKDKAAQRRRRG